jgi:hypothetical protein
MFFLLGRQSNPDIILARNGNMSRKTFQNIYTIDGALTITGFT